MNFDFLYDIIKDKFMNILLLDSDDEIDTIGRFINKDDDNIREGIYTFTFIVNNEKKYIANILIINNVSIYVQNIYDLYDIIFVKIIDENNNIIYHKTKNDIVEMLKNKIEKEISNLMERKKYYEN